MRSSILLRGLRGGEGALTAIAVPGPGRVLARFPAACYLELPGGLAVLTAPGVWEGPLHLTLDRPVPPCEAGSPVEVGPDGLAGPGWVVDVAGAGPWWGPLPPPREVLARAGTLRRALAGIAGRSRVPEEVADRARALLGTGALDRAVALLGGRGPGLTPAGDDALAGAFFLRRVVEGPTGEPALCAAASAARTGTIPRAFLRWAACGQALRPAHELLAAAARGDGAAAAGAARALAAVGASSGADFASGMSWVAETLAAQSGGGQRRGRSARSSRRSPTGWGGEPRPGGEGGATVLPGRRRRTS